MHRQRGFLHYDVQRNHYSIDWRESLSIVVGELLLQEILAARPYLKGRLLDVGCGKRPYALIYDSLVEISVGTEVDFSRHGVVEADVICYAEALPFAQHSFDTILCTEVLEHTQEPFGVMQEFARVLKPGGYLLLSVPFIYPVHEAPHDYWRFTAQGLEMICQSAGLTPIYIHPKGGIGTTIVGLWAQLAIRGVNLISKFLRLSHPLRNRAGVRWLLALPQWLFLTIARQKTIRLTTDSQLTSWMPVGFVLLAEYPLER